MSTLPSGVYRTGGSGIPGANAYQANQDQTFHNITRSDPYESQLTYNQILEISPAGIISTRALGLPANTVPLGLGEINKEFRGIPQTYTIETAIPTPKQGRWRVRLTNYVVSFPTPVIFWGDTNTSTAGAYPYECQLFLPGEIVIGFPSVTPPLTRVVTSRPNNSMTNHMDVATGQPPAGSVNVSRVAVSQTTASVAFASEPETSYGVPPSTPTLVGWHFPFTPENSREGIRNGLAVIAETSAAQNLGTATVETKISGGNVTALLDITRDTGTEPGIPVHFQIIRSVFSTTLSSELSGELYDGPRTAKVYLTWELTPITQTLGM